MTRVKKKYRKKKRKSIIKSRYFLIFLISLISSLFFGSILLVDSFYELEVVEIEGANLTSSGSLRNFVRNKSKINFIVESDSLVFTSIKNLEKEILDAYPHIEKVDLKKIFPETIHVKITEREKEAIWCMGPESVNDCFKIDSQGIAFEKINKSENFNIFYQLPGNIELGSRVLPFRKIDFIFEAKEKMEESFELKKMVIPHERSLFIKTAIGFEIRVDFEDELEDQIERLEILLEEEIDDVETLEYIELRYGNSVYYKN